MKLEGIIYNRCPCCNGFIILNKTVSVEQGGYVKGSLGLFRHGDVYKCNHCGVKLVRRRELIGFLVVCFIVGIFSYSMMYFDFYMVFILFPVALILSGIAMRNISYFEIEGPLSSGHSENLSEIQKKEKK